MSTAAVDADIRSMLRDGSTRTWAYLDVSENREDPRRLAGSRRTSIEQALVAAGADEEEARSVAATLLEPPGVPAPVSRYVIAERGAIVVDEILPGPQKTADSFGHGPVPDILPLLAHRPLDSAFLVVEVGRGGGGFRVYRFGHPGHLEQQQVQGRTDTLHKIAGGGWEHKRLQSHTEEMWRQNVAELATAIDETVRRTAARLVVVAGDIRARQLLSDAVSAETKALLSMVSVDTRADDASPDALIEQVDVALARMLATRVHDALDLVRLHLGRADATATIRLGEIVGALGSAQVDTLVIDPAAHSDDLLFALDDVPWVATSPEGALSARALGRIPATAALARAAVLMDTTVVLASAGSIPGANGMAALLRWPLGPGPVTASR